VSAEEDAEHGRGGPVFGFTWTKGRHASDRHHAVGCSGRAADVASNLMESTSFLMVFLV